MTFSALDSSLTGPLFATDAMRAVFSDEARLAAMLAAEAALARAQAQFELVPPSLADAIAAVGAGDLDAEAIGRRAAIAGVPTIPFLKALQARLPPELEPHLHKGATTQDVLDTALVLQMRAAFRLVARDLSPVLLGLERLAQAHRATPCAGRTYGQHAAPVTFGFKAAVWAAGLAEVAARLPDVARRALTPSLSGPVGTFAAMGGHGPAVVEAFAAELGLEAAPIAWHTRRVALVEAGTWLATLLGALAKLAGDVAHLATTEVGEVAEPHLPGRGGSSAMPHKRNPVGCTVILAAASAAKGHVGTLLDAMVAAHERPAGAWHAEWHALPALFGLASGALREARLIAEGLVVDAARMRANLQLTRGLLFADAVAGRLAAAIGREAAHDAVEAAADRVRAGAGSLAETLRANPSLAAIPDEILATERDLDAAVDAAGPWIDRALPVCAGARADLAALG
ncbi:MAG TPA: lyase family protein [Salinarimonas sp.]|nr:lyase family protein [Salinarimonas sp.]